MIPRKSLLNPPLAAISRGVYPYFTALYLVFQIRRQQNCNHEAKVKYQGINLFKFLVSKETVVLRRWERSKQKFGFIKRVDKGEITTVKDLES